MTKTTAETIAAPVERGGTMRLSLLERSLFVGILLAYLGLAVLYAIRTPLWQVPDEPAHYNYIAQVASNGCCPVIAIGDWDNAYLERIKAAGFSADSVGASLSTIQYEDHQPPLYYLLGSVVYRLTNGAPLALRLFSVSLGFGLLLVTWAIVRSVAPRAPWIALSATAIVAFVPQHVSMMAGINNDSLAELVIGIALLACVSYLGNGADHPTAPNTTQLLRWIRPPLTMGIILGIAFLTKLTAYPLAAVILVAVLWRWWDEKRPFRAVALDLAWIYIPAILLGGLWWGRNLIVYGGLDFLAQAAHDRVVVGQLTTAEYIAQIGNSAWISNGLRTTFNSFWGQFGWMAVPLQAPIYQGLMLVCAIAGVGVLIAWWRSWKSMQRPQRGAIVVMLTLTVLASAIIVYWNLKYVQFQGRYLFPALIPFACVLAIGLHGWAGLLATRWPSRWPTIRWAVTLFCCSLALLTLYSLFRALCPQLGCAPL